MLIYRWHPHGSKKPQDLKPLTDYKKHGDRFGATNPIMLCHDQEPLNHHLYSADVILQYLETKSQNAAAMRPFHKAISTWDLRACVELYNIYDHTLLLHSEQHSAELEYYSSLGFLPVYYWSHALIARDWYRYAQHDISLHHAKDIAWDFLIYNRAWSGSREYRLRFSEGLVDRALVSCCRTSFSAYCQGTHYLDHSWHNDQLRIVRRDLESHFVTNTAEPWASADYCTQDYQTSMIEVVLETLVDDSRWHLTEKCLRPIACAQPFILVATPGSLRYLRSYGFETFGAVIDESYDEITDTRKRLDAIQQEMQRIAHMNAGQKRRMQQELAVIARRNQQQFFSQQFHRQVVGEYQQNLQQALVVMEQHRDGQRLTQLKNLLDAVPGRAVQSRNRTDQLYQRIMQWNQDPRSVPESW